MHKGVGLLIRNPTNDVFFIQKKDAHYPIEKWVGAYSFWGGAVECNDASAFEALERELEEEVPFEFDSAQIVFVGEYLVVSDSDFLFRLYELTVSDAILENLGKLQVNEGHSELATKEQLLSKTWAWGLEKVIENYFMG